MKCVRVAFKTRFDRAQSIDLVVKIVGTAAAVAAVTEFTVCKTVAVPKHTHAHTDIHSTSPSPKLSTPSIGKITPYFKGIVLVSSNEKEDETMEGQ